MKPASREMFLQNTRYISAVGRFNKYKLIIVQKFFDSICRNKSIMQKQINLEEIIKFCIENEKLNKNPENQLIHDYILYLTSEAPAKDYLYIRYKHLNNPFYNELGFHLFSLIEFELIMREVIQEKIEKMNFDDNSKLLIIIILKKISN